MNFFTVFKLGMIETFSPLFVPKNYITRPDFIVVVCLLMSAFSAPLIFLLPYCLLVFIDYSYEKEIDVPDTMTEMEQCIQSANKFVPDTMTESAEDRMLRMLPNPTILKEISQNANEGEHLFELLFRSKTAIIISAIDEKDAVTKAELTQTDRSDLLGIAKL